MTLGSPRYWTGSGGFLVAALINHRRTMPITRRGRKGLPPGADHRAVYAVSLQEAATWINQARIAADKLGDEKSAAQLEKIGKNLRILHNRHSRIKMG